MRKTTSSRSNSAAQRATDATFGQNRGLSLAYLIRLKPSLKRKVCRGAMKLAKARAAIRALKFTNG